MPSKFDMPARIFIGQAVDNYGQGPDDWKEGYSVIFKAVGLEVNIITDTEGGDVVLTGKDGSRAFALLSMLQEGMPGVMEAADRQIFVVKTLEEFMTKTSISLGVLKS